MGDAKFSVDYSKRLSNCKKCKQEITKGGARIAKVTANVFHDGDGEMKSYFHFSCLFDTFKRARATTKIIESADDIEGFVSLKDDDKKSLIDLITELEKQRNKSSDKKTPAKKPVAVTASTSTIKNVTKKKENDDDGDDTDEYVEESKPSKGKAEDTDDEDDDNNKDKMFETFCKICDKIAGQSGSAKTQVLKEYFENGASGNGFKGNLGMFVKFLLPNSSNQVYNLNSVSLVKLFSKIFGEDQDEMLKHLNNGDVANTIKVYFEKSKRLKPQKTSKLTLVKVNRFLEKLTKHRLENEQLSILKEIAENCTSNDLLMIIRLIKKDLRINSGEKVILDAVAPNAYNAFKVSRDLDDVVNRLLKSPLKKDLSIKINLMKPVKPMLADACKSCESALIKCKETFVEIKYDGERLQVHKNGSTFNYFSRNLKQVPAHKVEHLKEFIPKAFPNAHDLILDGEVLLYDTKNKKPLPFGTLGVHKKTHFKDALVCYFIFDIIYMNGKDLMNETLKDRRKILEKTVNEIPGRIMLSEKQHVTKADKLRELMMKAIRDGLEGLVIKDVNGKYEPGKRHWLKMKKDYLDEGKMADTADLVVLGAYYGTGNKGGLKSVFLMGVYNEKLQKWQTVTKCGNGFDDKKLDELQDDLDMIEINKDYNKVPEWLDVHKTVTPDFVIRNPKKSQVWEITGAEFSKSDVHTASGISIRFPRVTRVRDDKTWKEATDLERLKTLFKISKEKTDVEMDEVKDAEDVEEEEDEPRRKSKSKKRSSNEIEESDRDKKKSKKDTQKTPLPAIFSNVKIYIPNDVDNSDKLKRYIIAYDGEVVDNYHIEDATHIIKQDDMELEETNNKNTVYINIDDLWNCIKMRKTLDSIN